MSQKSNVSGWVDYVYSEWFYCKGKKPPEPPRLIRESSEILVEKMRQALDDGQNEQVVRIVDRLKKLNGIGPLDNSKNCPDDSLEALVECAIALYKIGDTQEALKFLELARYARYASHWHYRAIILWLSGCFHWLSLLHVDDAIAQWEQAWELFSRYGAKDPDPNWYAKRAEKMRRAIDLSTHENILVAHTDVRLEDPLQPVRMVNSASSGRACLPRHTLELFSVFGKITAGNPAHLTEPHAAMAVDELFLEQARHRIISLKPGDKSINLVDGRGCFILKVSGNSMNNATPEPIANGDYVLIRAQLTAQQGDIVAAEIVGYDDRATLKRYSVVGGKILLQPESTDPAFQLPIIIQREFSKMDNSFHIRGIALAVLKRL